MLEHLFQEQYKSATFSNSQTSQTENHEFTITDMIF